MGTLSIVSTPIGNLEDSTIRAIRTLFLSDIIACEDTRRTGALLRELQKRYGAIIDTDSHPQLIRYDNHNEQSVSAELIEALRGGKSVALVSDAGTPLISDPGFVLVRQARKHGISVVSIPGPSALLAALASSGLPADKFLFLGYPPEKRGHRIAVFSALPKDITIIFYCAPHKLRTTLEDIKGALGDIAITICRELTKIHEEIWTGTISEALQRNYKGELVLLLRLS